MKVSCLAPDRRGPGQNCAQQVTLAHVAFGQRVVSKHLHRERKKHRQPDVLPDQQTQVFNGQSPDRLAPQGMRRRNETSGVGWGCLPAITFKLLEGPTTVDRHSHQAIFS